MKLARMTIAVVLVFVGALEPAFSFASIKKFTSSLVPDSRFTAEALSPLDRWFHDLKIKPHGLFENTRAPVGAGTTTSTYRVRWTIPVSFVQKLGWPEGTEHLMGGNIPMPRTLCKTLEERLRLYQDLSADPRQDDVVDNVVAFSELLPPLHNVIDIYSGSEFNPVTFTATLGNRHDQVVMGLPEEAWAPAVSPYVAIFLLGQSQRIANNMSYQRVVNQDAGFMRTLKAIMRATPQDYEKFKTDLTLLLNHYPAKRYYLDFLSELELMEGDERRQRIALYNAQAIRRQEEQPRWDQTFTATVYNTLARDLNNQPAQLQAIVARTLITPRFDFLAVMERLFAAPIGYFQTISQAQIDEVILAIRFNARAAALCEELGSIFSTACTMWAFFNPTVVRDPGSDREPFLRVLIHALQTIIGEVNSGMKWLAEAHKAQELLRTNIPDVLEHQQLDLLAPMITTLFSGHGPNAVAKVLLLTCKQFPQLEKTCYVLASRYTGVSECLTNLAKREAPFLEIFDWLDELTQAAWTLLATTSLVRSSKDFPGRPVTTRQITPFERAELYALVNTALGIASDKHLPPGELPLHDFQLAIAQGMSRWFFIADPWSLEGGLICLLAVRDPDEFQNVVSKIRRTSAPRGQRRASYLALFGYPLIREHWAKDHDREQDPLKRFYDGLIDPVERYGQDPDFMADWNMLSADEHHVLVHDMQVAALVRLIFRWSSFPIFDENNTEAITPYLADYPRDRFNKGFASTIPYLLNSERSALAPWEVEQAYRLLMEMLQKHAALGADRHPRAQPLRLAALEAIPQLKAAIRNNPYYPNKNNKKGNLNLWQLVEGTPGGELYTYEQAEKNQLEKAASTPIIVHPNDLPNTAFSSDGQPLPGLNSLGLNFELSDAAKDMVIERVKEVVAEVAKTDPLLAARLIQLPRASLHGNLKVDQWKVKLHDLPRLTARLRRLAEDIARYSPGLDAAVGGENIFGYTIGMSIIPATDMDLQTWKQLQWAVGRRDDVRFPVYLIHISSILVPTLRDPERDTQCIYQAVKTVRERHQAEKRLAIPIRSLQINFAPSYAEFQPQGNSIPLLFRDEWDTRKRAGAKKLAQAMQISASALAALQNKTALSVVSSSFPDLYLSGGDAMLVALDAGILDVRDVVRRMQGGSLTTRLDGDDLIVQAEDPEPSVAMMAVLLDILRPLGHEINQIRHSGRDVSKGKFKIVLHSQWTINWAPFRDAIRSIPDVLFSPTVSPGQGKFLGLNIRFYVPPEGALDVAAKIYKGLASFDSRILVYSLFTFPWINGVDMLDLSFRIPSLAGDEIMLRERVDRIRRWIKSFGESIPGVVPAGFHKLGVSLAEAA